jgi:hypothetical protein
MDAIGVPRLEIYRNVDARLQRRPDEHSPLAALSRKIVTAWYLGVVSEGDRNDGERP